MARLPSLLWAEDPIGRPDHSRFNFPMPGRFSRTSQPDPHVASTVDVMHGT